RWRRTRRVIPPPQPKPGPARSIVKANVDRDLSALRRNPSAPCQNVLRTLGTSSRRCHMSASRIRSVPRISTHPRALCVGFTRIAAVIGPIMAVTAVWPRLTRSTPGGATGLLRRLLPPAELPVVDLDVGIPVRSQHGARRVRVHGPQEHRGAEPGLTVV